MKKRNVISIPATNALVVLSALCAACSAVVRIVWACREDAISRPTLWLQVYLPIAAALWFALMLFTSAKDRLYRTSVPLWLGCIYFAVRAFTLDTMLHTVLCLCLYTLVGVLYTVTVTGHIPTAKPLWALFGLPLLYHVLIEHRISGPTGGWLAEGSVLLIMAALLLASLAMKVRPAEEGEDVKQFGDRSDGRRLRKLSPIFAVSPYLMKTRNTSQNFIQDSVEITNLEKYIAAKRKAGLKNFGILHVWLAAYARACARYPGLNRFISGQKIYSRGRELEVNMTIKKEMSTDSPDTVIKVELDPADTAEDVYNKFNLKVQEVKNAPLDSGFDNLAGALNFVPGLLLKFVVWVLEVLDYFGCLPRWLTKLSPFHASVYITSMASLGIPPIFHHLYDFGNVPVFISFGKKRHAYETQRDGTVVFRKYVDACYVTDERIVDGFYFASVLRYIHNLIHDPSQLDLPPEEIREDQE